MIKVKIKANKKRIYEQLNHEENSKHVSVILDNIKPINEDELTENESNLPIEEYVEDTDFKVLAKLLAKATKSAEKAAKDDLDVTVSELKIYGDKDDSVEYFAISDNYSNVDAESYVIYQIGADIYYRNATEFFLIIEDLKDEVPSQTIDSLKVCYADKNEKLSSYPITDTDDCNFIVSSIFSALTGKSYDSNLTENCKIKRSTKVDTDEDPDLSKRDYDAKYGTKELHDFNLEIEDKLKKDGLVGALDPLQDEENASYKPTLPNVNLVTENIELLLENIEYEVNDKVIYKGDLWDVFSVITGPDGVLHLRITRGGLVLDVTGNQVKPDLETYKELLAINQFEFDKNNLTKTPKNEKPEKMADLNEMSIPCNIVVDSTVLTRSLNGESFKANLKDIMEGTDNVRVQVGDTEETWNKDNIQIEKENWPYGVIAAEDDEPLRKIKVDPLSYVEAKEDDDMVICTVADKVTLFPKKVIRIIAI